MSEYADEELSRTLAALRRKRGDARQVAEAAPDLLKELKHLVRLIEPCIADGRVSIPGLATLNAAHAAIAKAESKS